MRRAVRAVDTYVVGSVALLAFVTVVGVNVQRAAFERSSPPPQPHAVRPDPNESFWRDALAHRPALSPAAYAAQRDEVPARLASVCAEPTNLQMDAPGLWTAYCGGRRTFAVDFDEAGRFRRVWRL